MTVLQDFSNEFSEENLKSIYLNHISLSQATGIDNLKQNVFIASIDENIEVISRKVLSGNYQFTKYKLKLISRGKNKYPREISIPTIRDRVALRALCQFLMKRYESEIQFSLPQNLVRDVKEAIESNQYDGFIKLDVSNFYPSIKHNELEKRLGRKIRDKKIIDIIDKSLKTPTVIKSNINDNKNPIGIPQGLSISNILAAIYLLNVDSYLKAMTDIKYYRYVDDVLILCKLDAVEDIAIDVIKRFKKIGLKVYDPKKNPEKSKIGKLTEEFGYLGYQFHDGLISARFGSVNKLMESIASIFTGYKNSKYKNPNFLEWRLNIRITGCIFENKCKGWLFFFSEINDESLLHRLDLYVAAMVERFGVDIHPKSFVRAYYQIKFSRYQSEYVPNFDNYDIDMMKDVLAGYFGKNIDFLSDSQIEFEFRKRIKRQVKDILTDVQDFGY